MQLCAARGNERKLHKKARREARRAFGLIVLGGNQNGIHNVNDAVRLVHIADGDARNATFGIDDFEIFALAIENQGLALHRFQFRAAFAPLDERDEVSRAVFARNDVVSQNRGQRAFVFGLNERVNGSGGQLGERGVGGREHGERAGAGQCFHQTGGSDSRDKRGVIDGYIAAPPTSTVCSAVWANAAGAMMVTATLQVPSAASNDKMRRDLRVFIGFLVYSLC